MEDTDDITPFEVARLRLLSSAVSKGGNDNSYLGPHDAHIIYMNRANVKFGIMEITRLLDFGLINISTENVPLWYWYNVQKQYIGGDPLPLKSLSYSYEDICVGAMEASRVLEM